MKNITIFGNPDLPMDSLPIRIIPELRRLFPDTEFTVIDPNEEWNIPEELIVIDTVVGIADIAIFHDLKSFIGAPKLTCHDFDAYSNLVFLQKLGKLRKIKIIGIPPDISQKNALESLTKLLQTNSI